MSYHENNPQFTIGGVTYNEDMVPIGFSQDYATGFNDQIDRPPLNALAASVTASNGTDYGIYTTVNGINTEIKTLDENATVISNRNDDGTWNTKDDYKDVFSEDDENSAENNLQELIKDNPNFSNSVSFEEEALQDLADDATLYDKDGNYIGGSLPGGDASLANQVIADYDIGKVDHIIQKLALRNLIYPIDADFGNTQDYIQINQFTYKPINREIFFPTTEAGAGAFKILQKGVENVDPKQDHLGLVKLPMPNQLQDSNNVAWGQDQLNAITAAAAAGVFDVTGDAIDSITKAIGTGSFGGAYNSLKDDLSTRAENFLGNARGAAAEAGTTLASKNAQLLGRSILGSFLLNIPGFGVTPETALARGAGVIPNSNMQLLFNAPTLREFTFNWRLTARSREEATRIKNIIRFFKQGMAVKKGNKTKSGSSRSFFLGTPNIFDIQFKTVKQNYEILDRNDSVMRIKTCALTGVAVNYTPDGMWNAYEKGMPTSVLLSLRFGELEPIFDTDYEEDPFEYSTDRRGVSTVPIDAIGY